MELLNSLERIVFWFRALPDYGVGIVFVIYLLLAYALVYWRSRVV